MHLHGDARREVAFLVAAILTADAAFLPNLGRNAEVHVDKFSVFSIQKRQEPLTRPSFFTRRLESRLTLFPAISCPADLLPTP